MKDDLAYIGDLSGPAYDWLGHFRTPTFLCEGHNTDDAEELDETVQRLGEDRLPTQISDKPQGAWWL